MSTVQCTVRNLAESSVRSTERGQAKPQTEAAPRLDGPSQAGRPQHSKHGRAGRARRGFSRNGHGMVMLNAWSCGRASGLLPQVECACMPPPPHVPRYMLHLHHIARRRDSATHSRTPSLRGGEAMGGGGPQPTIMLMKPHIDSPTHTTGPLGCTVMYAKPHTVFLFPQIRHGSGSESRSSIGGGKGPATMLLWLRLTPTLPLSPPGQRGRTFPNPEPWGSPSLEGEAGACGRGPAGLGCCSAAARVAVDPAGPATRLPVCPADWCGVGRAGPAGLPPDPGGERRLAVERRCPCRGPLARRGLRAPSVA